MRKGSVLLRLSAAAVLFIAALTGLAGAQQASDSALAAKARAIHDRVIALDTHVDIDPHNFTTDHPNYTDRLTTQVNLPKMLDGGLDAVFFSIFVGQGPLTPEGYQRAYDADMEKFAAVHRLAEQLAPDKIEIAYRADDVARIAAKGKKVALMGVENAYGIGTAITNIKRFYDQGARYMSLAHNGHSQMSDSNTGERDGVWLYHGLSPLGKQAVAELNRVGIMIDISHPSKESMMQTLALTKAPIIASHSAVRALCDVSRNLDDEQLLALKKNGGVVQMVAFSSYVKQSPPPSPERQQALAAVRTEFGLPPAAGAGGGGGGGRGASLQSLPAEKRAEYQRRVAQVDSQFPPPPRATVKDFVDHIDYAVKLIGVDHVGISSDFDGGGGVDGWSQASETFNVTLELVRRGYTEEQISKVWSGNLLRVMRDVEKVAAGLQRQAN
ncbi:MAG TPA: dipeptidase [Gemmatimonadaceae bacterium]|jgi:membrane dipeptidase